MVEQKEVVDKRYDVVNTEVESLKTLCETTVPSADDLSFLFVEALEYVFVYL